MKRHREHHAHNLARCVALAAGLAVLPAWSASADGESIYRAKCSTCHDSGTGDAPRISHPEEWKARFATGRAAMQEAAIRGKPNTAMAPKGGFAELSDGEVRAAVDHMLARSGFVDAVAPAAGRPAKAAAAAPQSDVRRSDQEITKDVASALHAALAAPSSIIEAQDAELIVRGIGVRVYANGGVVRLMGVVEKADTLRRAEALTRAVPGVRGIDNKLVTGGMLEFD